MITFEAYQDISEKVIVGIYSQKEGNLLKDEYSAFITKQQKFAIHLTDIEGLSEAQAITAIAEKFNISENLASYFVSLL